MSELTDRVRKMLSQAQVFARDTPFEAVSRARQAMQVVESAFATASDPEERTDLENLRTLAAKRVERYQAVLDSWIEASQKRADAFNQRERDVIGQPLRHSLRSSY